MGGGDVKFDSLGQNKSRWEIKNEGRGLVATPHLILNILHNNYARWPEKETINDRMKLPAKSYKGGESPAGKVAGSREGRGRV